MSKALPKPDIHNRLVSPEGFEQKSVSARWRCAPNI